MLLNIMVSFQPSSDSTCQQHLTLLISSLSLKPFHPLVLGHHSLYISSYFSPDSGCFSSPPSKCWRLWGSVCRSLMQPHILGDLNQPPGSECHLGAWNMNLCGSDFRDDKQLCLCCPHIPLSYQCPHQFWHSSLPKVSLCWVSMKCAFCWWGKHKGYG